MSTVVRSDATPIDPRDFAVAVRDSLTTGKALRLQLGDVVCEIHGELANTIVNLISAVGSGRAVEVNHLPDQLTTGQAADLLGVSRPTVVSLVDTGRLPGTRIGTHRRIATTDVLAYRDRVRTQSQTGLQEIVAISRDLGLYDE